MGFGDEKSDWVICPDNVIWGDFWNTMEVLEVHLQSETTRRNLFEGKCDGR